MPRISSWFVRASLVYLSIGFSLGMLLLVNKGLVINAAIWKLLPIHSELLLIGWLVLLTAGVAYWILPRLSGEAPRGNVKLTWLSFWLINLGLGMVIVEVITSYSVLSLLGRLAELGGVIAFVACSWKRVKTFGG